MLISVPSKPNISSMCHQNLSTHTHASSYFLNHASSHPSPNQTEQRQPQIPFTSHCFVIIIVFSSPFNSTHSYTYIHAENFEMGVGVVT